MTAATIEIWIRTKGARRQAFYRPEGQIRWKIMSVTKADKALREGAVLIGDSRVPVVSRETIEPMHPAAEAFRATAALLNQQIDTITGGVAP